MNRDKLIPEKLEPPMPLCPVHQKIDDDPKGELILIYSHGCVACSLGERDLLLDMLAPFAAKDGKEDSLTVLRRLADFYDAHVAEGRVILSYPAPTGEPK